MGRDMKEAGYSIGSSELPYHLSKGVPLSHLHMFTKWKLSEPCPLGFMEDSLHRIWLMQIHWPLQRYSTQPSPHKRPGIRKFQPSNHMVGSPGNQYPHHRYFQGSISTTKQKHLYTLNTGNLRDLQELWAGTLDEEQVNMKNIYLVICMTKHIFLLFILSQMSSICQGQFRH